MGIYVLCGRVLCGRRRNVALRWEAHRSDECMRRQCQGHISFLLLINFLILSRQVIFASDEIQARNIGGGNPIFGERFSGDAQGVYDVHEHDVYSSRLFPQQHYPADPFP